MLVALYGPNSPVGRFLEKLGVQVIFATLGILLALLFVTLPLVVRRVEPVLLELDLSEEEAAQVLGAGGWTTFRGVVLPAHPPGRRLRAAPHVRPGHRRVRFHRYRLRQHHGPDPHRARVHLPAHQPVQAREAAAVATLLFAMSFALVLLTERLVNAAPGDEPLASTRSAAAVPCPTEAAPSGRGESLLIAGALAYVAILLLAPLGGIVWIAVKGGSGVVADTLARPTSGMPSSDGGHRGW